MFELKATIQNRVDRVRRAARDAARGSFSRAAFVIRKTMVESIERQEGPSDPGSPPHTHKGNFFRRAIRYAVDKLSAVIGTMYSVVGDIGKAHEFGGQFRGQEYPVRAFAEPALMENLDVVPQSWDGSIGE